MADAIEAAEEAVRECYLNHLNVSHRMIVEAALAAADAARLKDAPEIAKALNSYRELCKDDSKVWSLSTIWRCFEEAAALITAQAARIEALEMALKSMIDLDECEAHFEDAYERILPTARATLEGK